MNIIKRNNREEKFEREKLERSIKNSARDINYQINTSDIKLISNEVLRRLILFHGINGLTTSYEVIGMSVDVLKEYKFDLIVPSYLNLL